MITNNQKWHSMAIEIINKHSISKVTLPFHDLEYRIIVPKEEQFSGDPLNGRINDKHINVTISHYDNNYIIADMTVTDPALGNRTVWEGQILFNKDINQLTAINRKQHDAYVIDVKLIQPSIESPRFILDILSL
ncbi:MAG: hypothetical protein ACYCQI_14495 [Gammaproteobacteria bacterium]